MDLSDYEIIQKCLAGDVDVFSEMVSRYKKLVYSVVYNLLADKQEVYDVAQESFLRAYQHLFRYNPEYKFSTWIVRIATNLCHDIHKKKKADYVSIDEIGDIKGNCETPETHYIEKEQKERLFAAVNALPEMYRIPIVLYHQNNLSYDEIARALDEPMSVVKNRIYRARIMLKEKLYTGEKEVVL